MKLSDKLWPSVVALLLISSAWWAYSIMYSSGNALVVYCAHDAVYSDAVLERFTKETGIKVAVKHDTEATKSLGLVELLVREKAHPRCDVFWNNELLGMLQLQEAGVLAAYRGSGFSRIPDQFKEPSGLWTGFAARARVMIVNTENVASITDEEVQRRLSEDDLSRTAIAKPMYGTTLTHYSVIWQELGAAGLKAWHEETRKKGMQEVNGNAVTRDLVASGTCDVAFTDTDDYFAAKDRGAPVTLLPARTAEGATICIPNTVALIKGSTRKEKAKKLIDYLLSAENEIALAGSESRQIPLGSVDVEQLPEEVRSLLSWISECAPLKELGPARAECLQWLKGLDDG